MTRPRGLASCCLAAAAVLYLWNLGRAPIYLGGDEAHFGVQGYALATTGRDLSGRRFPLFINLSDAAARGDKSVRWYQPALFYATALVLKIAPLSEWSTRLPAALLGLLDLWLMFLVAGRITGRSALAVLALVMLALTPAHLIFSRQATDYLFPAAFALGWLWFLLISLDSNRLWPSLAAGLVLGLGFYSHISAWVLMPGLLLTTWITQYRAGRARASTTATAAAGFAVMLLPVAAWLLAYPAMLTETLARYGLRSAPLGAGAVQHVISTYLSFFDPILLLRTGGLSMTTATHRSGVFLLPMAVLIPVGMFEAIRRGRSLPIAPALLIGFFIAPAAGATVGEPGMVQRALLLLPFGVLLATIGTARLWASRRPFIRTAVAVLLAMMPLQFAYFYRDYLTNYQHRSAFYFDPVDFRDVAEYLVAADAAHPLPDIYMSDQLDDAAARWRFQATAQRREDLLPRTEYNVDIARVELRNASPGSALVMYADGARVAEMVRTGAWTLGTIIFDVDGRQATAILRKAN